MKKIKKLLYACAAVTAVAIAATSLPENSVADITDVTKDAVLFDSDIGDRSVAKYQINEKQSIQVTVSRHSDTILDLGIINSNSYVEKGDTFNNYVIFYDKNGQPLTVYHNQRGVTPKLFHKSARTTKTRKKLVFEKQLLDRIRYFRVYGDNKVDTDRIAKKYRSAIEKGILDGVTELTKKTISSFAPDLKKAILKL